MAFNSRPYIIAEVGNNHDGCKEKAIRLIHAAKESGADSVKFQCIDYEKWVTNSLPVFARASKSGCKTQLERLNAIRLSIDDYVDLASECKAIGIDFGCTVFDEDALLALSPYMTYNKISSGEMFNIDTLRLHSNEKVKPVVMSTGLARSEVDIINAVSHLKGCNLYILHCVSTYPLKNEESALGNIKALQYLFGSARVGYSDHTIGLDACKEALNLGSVIIEKHFKLDEDCRIGDKPISATPSELKSLVEYAQVLNNDKAEDHMHNSTESDGFVFSAHKTASWNQLVRKAHTRKAIKRGSRIEIDDCSFVISGEGYFTSLDIYGKEVVAIQDLPQGRAIMSSDISHSL